MAFIAAAAIAAAAIGAGASMKSGSDAAAASKEAAGQQMAAADRANATQIDFFNQSKELAQPYVQGGNNALKDLLAALNVGGAGGATNPVLTMLGLGPKGPTGTGIDPSQFRASPGYEFMKQQGLDAITNSAAARGGIGGNALKALMQYGSGIADQSWQQYLTNAQGGWQSLVGALAGLTNMGAGAAESVGKQSVAVGSDAANSIMAGGNALAGGTIGSANALTGGIGGAVGNIQQALMLQRLLGSSGAGAAGANASAGAQGSALPLSAGAPSIGGAAGALYAA